MATYNIWLTNSIGDKIASLSEMSFFNYSISVHSIGTFQMGIPYNVFKSKIGSSEIFSVDRMIEVWRSADEGFASKLERIYFLRKVVKYRRKEDSVLMLSFYGRDAKDLLNRRTVIQAEGSAYTKKTDYVDDMMKEIVSQQMLFGSALDETGVSDNSRAWPQALFSVQGDISRGPSVTHEVANKKVLDACRELHDISKQKNIDSSTNKIIYFDVVEKMSSTGKFGFEFQTYETLRGADRTKGLRFSVANGNLESPSTSEEYYEEANVVYSKGEGRGEERLIETVEDTNRSGASPWARSEIVASSGATTAAEAQEVGNRALRENRPIEQLDVTFLSSPGDRYNPRSLYGVDWKVGDLLPVNFAGEYYEAEVKIVYASVNEKGEETLTGRVQIGE